MEEKFKNMGVNVKFIFPNFPVPSEQDLLSAKIETQTNTARMLVARPEFMEVNGITKPITINNLRELFKAPNATGAMIEINPFGTGSVFYKQDWYDNEGFANEQLSPSYSFVTKDVIPDSTSKDWQTQESLVNAKGEKRRTAVEAVWDNIFYYGATGNKLLETKYDWTKTGSSDGDLVRVGGFASSGLGVDDWIPGRSNDDLGVVLSR